MSFRLAYVALALIFFITASCKTKKTAKADSTKKEVVNEDGKCPDASSLALSLSEAVKTVLPPQPNVPNDFVNKLSFKKLDDGNFVQANFYEDQNNAQGLRVVIDPNESMDGVPEYLKERIADFANIKICDDSGKCFSKQSYSFTEVFTIPASFKLEGVYSVSAQPCVNNRAQNTKDYWECSATYGKPDDIAANCADLAKGSEKILRPECGDWQSATSIFRNKPNTEATQKKLEKTRLCRQITQAERNLRPLAQKYIEGFDPNDKSAESSQLYLAAQAIISGNVSPLLCNDAEKNLRQQVRAASSTDEGLKLSEDDLDCIKDPPSNSDLDAKNTEIASLKDRLKAAENKAPEIKTNTVTEDKFVFKRGLNGYGEIRFKSGRKCLQSGTERSGDYFVWKLKNATCLGTVTDNSDPFQTWDAVTLSGSVFHLQQQNNKERCLTRNASNLEIKQCDESNANQRWAINKNSSDDKFTIRSIKDAVKYLTFKTDKDRLAQTNGCLKAGTNGYYSISDCKGATSFDMEQKQSGFSSVGADAFENKLLKVGGKCLYVTDKNSIVGTDCQKITAQAKQAFWTIKRRSKSNTVFYEVKNMGRNQCLSSNVNAVELKNCDSEDFKQAFASVAAISQDDWKSKTASIRLRAVDGFDEGYKVTSCLTFDKSLKLDKTADCNTSASLQPQSLDYAKGMSTSVYIPFLDKVVGEGREGTASFYAGTVFMFLVGVPLLYTVGKLAVQKFRQSTGSLYWSFGSKVRTNPLYDSLGRVEFGKAFNKKSFLSPSSWFNRGYERITKLNNKELTSKIKLEDGEYKLVIGNDLSETTITKEKAERLMGKDAQGKNKPLPIDGTPLETTERYFEAKRQIGDSKAAPAFEKVYVRDGGLRFEGNVAEVKAANRFASGGDSVLNVRGEQGSRVIDYEPTTKFQGLFDWGGEKIATTTNMTDRRRGSVFTGLKVMYGMAVVGAGLAWAMTAGQDSEKAEDLGLASSDSFKNGLKKFEEKVEKLKSDPAWQN